MSGNIHVSITNPATTTTDLFADSPFLYPARNAFVSLAVVGATGQFVSVYSGGRLIMAESPIQVQTTIEADRDYQINFQALAGERLTVSVRNPTAGGLAVLASAQIADTR